MTTSILSHHNWRNLHIQRVFLLNLVKLTLTSIQFSTNQAANTTACSHAGQRGYPFVFSTCLIAN